MLVESGKLAASEFSDEQVVGLWAKAVEAYEDSHARPRSWNGQFRDLYESGRLAATAILAATGYRPKGADHHRSALVGAAEFSPEAVNEAFYAVEGARGNRHDTNYGSEDVVDESDVKELREAIEVVLTDGAKHLRTMRPDAKGRIRMIRAPRR